MKLDVLGSVLCTQCPAACCRYVALPLDKPRTLRDYDDIRWYLLHQGFSVFVEDGDWYVQIESRCKHLREDNLCGAYDTRPAICREYEPGDCDYVGGDYGYDHLFTHPSQLEAFVEHKLGKRLGNPAGMKPGGRGASRNDADKIGAASSPGAAIRLGAQPRPTQKGHRNRSARRRKRMRHDRPSSLRTRL